MTYQKNKHIKTVTRDRASAYAKVVSEELPDAMQIADRFHLHQNLLEIVKKCIASALPETVRIESDCNPNVCTGKLEENIQNAETSEDMDKKNLICCG